MPTLKTPILAVGLSKISNLGFEVLYESSAQKAIELLKHQPYDILIVSTEAAFNSKILESFQNLQQTYPAAQKIIVVDSKSDQLKVINLLNKFPTSHVLPMEKIKSIEDTILKALEKSNWIKQNLELEKLVKGQREKLNFLHQDLEDRVDKRQKFLLDSRRKTHVAQLRWESLKQAMIAIQQTQSIAQMEHLLTESLKKSLQLSMIRIFFTPKKALIDRQFQDFFFHHVPIFKNQKEIGSVYFFRQHKTPYNKEETEFLERVTEAVSLAIDRLSQLEQAETLREQWQTTFNSVLDPILVVNEKYQIIQTNSSFLEKGGMSDEDSKKVPCYKALFQRDNPCVDCQMGKSFRLENKNYVIDVTSQALETQEKLKTYVHFYHDMTEQVKIERKILESTRLAEMGTIGSSIAHELNNPLAGILSFVQLMKMDVKKDEPIFEDLSEMENGVLRCRDIIENLLGFSRLSSPEETKDFDLRDALDRACRLVELKSRSRGIEMKIHLPIKPVIIRGHQNSMIQALSHLLQQSINSFDELGSSTRAVHGLIEVKLEEDGDNWKMLFIDNGPGIRHQTDVHASLAKQIILDHGGDMEISSPTRQMTMTKISFPRPVLVSTRHL